MEENVTDVLAMENYERILADEIYFKKVKPRLDNQIKNAKPRKTKNESLYQKLVMEANRMKVDVDNIFADTDTKKRHLRDIMGYKRLRDTEGSIPLDDCSDSRIGYVYRKAYYSGNK